MKLGFKIDLTEPVSVQSLVFIFLFTTNPIRGKLREFSQ